MKMDNRFCVIGDSSANSKGFNRTWFSTHEEAVQHATRLITAVRNTDDRKALYVVEARTVVRPKADYEVLSLD